MISAQEIMFAALQIPNISHILQLNLQLELISQKKEITYSYSLIFYKYVCKYDLFACTWKMTWVNEENNGHA